MPDAVSGAIAVDNLTVAYGSNTVVYKVGFRTDRGRLVGVVGPNGAGKTTLIKALLGLVPARTGAVSFWKGPLRETRRWIAYVPQRSQIDWDFPINVLETVLLGTYPYLGLFRRPGRAERERAMACLEQVGMADYAHRQIGALSGGQQQRVFIARALAQDAELFFLDEPFIGIDVQSEQTIVRVLRTLRDAGKTALIVHHDLNKVPQYFDDVLLINKTLIGYGPVEEVFTRDKLVAAFASQLPLLQQLGVSP